MELAVTFDGAPPEDYRAELERAGRIVRACTRRWSEQSPPAMHVGSGESTAQERVYQRITDFLRALADVHSATNAALTLRGSVVTAASPLEGHQSDRIVFVLHRLDAEARRTRGVSSHSDIADADVYAASFWYGAAIIVFFDQDYAQDFVRHRVRLVSKEISALLSTLDSPPRDPAKVSPIPD